MKALLVTMTFMFTQFALAHSGSNTLTCKSAKNSGSKQMIQLSLSRGNTAGLAAPTISMKVDGQAYTLDTPEDTLSYGETFHNSPLGVVRVTAENYNDNAAAIRGGFSVVAIPSTVRAFDNQGHPVKWSLKSEKDECNDSNGKATFQGVFHGDLNANKKDVSVEPQILDCELVYDSGMAC